MLDKEEFKKASELFGLGFKSAGPMEERFKPLVDCYKDLTGWNETNPNAIMHHAIELYGPPCENCGKPYRTSQASFCAACGHKRI